MTPQNKPNKARTSSVQPNVEPNLFEKAKAEIRGKKMDTRKFLEFLSVHRIHPIREDGGHVIVQSQDTGRTAKVPSHRSLNEVAMGNVLRTALRS